MKNLFAFSALSLLILSQATASQILLVTKNYVDQGLATKQNAMPIPSKGGQVLMINSSANGLEWKPIEGIGASYVDVMPIAEPGFAIDASQTSVRKDLKNGIVSLNVVVYRTGSALTLNSSGGLGVAYIKFATLPPAFWLTETGKTWIMTPFVGIGSGLQTNPFSMWMDATGGLWFYHYGSGAYTLNVNARFGTSAIFQAGL